MSLVLGTLVLNEMEWLPRLYEQHKSWPGLRLWVFSEAADQEYARTNPKMVSPAGLSVDGTSEFLEELARRDDRVVYIRHGFSIHSDPAVGKMAARQRCVEEAHKVAPEFFINLDADEFYTFDHQLQLLETISAYPEERRSWIFPRREIWHPPYCKRIGDPLFKYEAVGGFWKIPCCHWFRYDPSMVYDRCHNMPTILGRPANDHIVDVRDVGTPVCMIHMGFAAAERERRAKHEYYAGRGEATDPNRKWYVRSRGEWFDWKPGNVLCRGAEVVPYDGPVPEVFKPRGSL